MRKGIKFLLKAVLFIWISYFLYTVFLYGNMTESEIRQEFVEKYGDRPAFASKHFIIEEIDGHQYVIYNESVTHHEGCPNH